MRIAVVGGAGGWRAVKDYKYPIWTISVLLKRMNTVNIDPCLILEVHKKAQVDKRLELIKASKALLVLARPHKQLPYADILPIQKIISRYSRKCLTSSISWLIAYAGYMGVSQIDIYGVDMKTKPEYKEQRDGLFWLMGYMEAEGVRFNIPDTSKLYMPEKLYGDVNYAIKSD